MLLTRLGGVLVQPAGAAERLVARPAARNRGDVDISTAMHNWLTRVVFAKMLMGKN